MRSRLLLPALLAAAGGVQAQALPDVLLKEFQRQSGATGMAAAIVRDGRLVWHGEVGYADAARKRPVTQQTEFRLGSVSKFVTTAMLARLVDQGRIDLNRPVHHYLADYPAKAHPFTTLHLATHTSGMPHYQATDAGLDEREQPYRTVGEGLAIFKDRPLQAAPGAKFEYSSFGYNLLSAVMEKAAKEDFVAMISDTARLAGAPSLHAERLETAGAHWSQLYDQEGTELPRRNITHKWAGGGMLGNAPDLARFGQKTLDPAFINPRTLALFTTPQQLADGSQIAEPGFRQGIGWRVSADYFGRPYFHHSGSISGGRSHLSVYPEQKAAVSVLANASFTSSFSLTAEALFDAQSASAEAGACRDGKRSYAGTFRDLAVAGEVRYSKEGAYCRIDISADNALGARMGRKGLPPGIVAFSLPGRETAYFVTPVGIFPGKAGAGALAIQTLSSLIELRLE
jgi:CubicO group peptidase (beta-lactamase class C family)